MSKVEIKINYEDFKDLEFMLFSLVYPKETEVKVLFFDNDLCYNYVTKQVDDNLVLVTC